LVVPSRKHRVAALPLDVTDRCQDPSQHGVLRSGLR